MERRPGPQSDHEQFRVGEWLVDGSGNRLVRGDEVRPLRNKAMALLLLLARRGGQTVSREEIVQQIWGGNVFVAPKAINNAVWTIRQALDDDPESPRYLETISKKGYRLIAPVHPVPAAPDRATAGVDAAAPARPSLRRSRLLRWASVGGAAIAAVLLWQRWAAPDGSAAPAPAVAWRDITPLTQYPGHEHVGALSPDGRMLAFGWWRGSGEGALYLRSAFDSAATVHQISGDAGEVTGVAWAPDSESLVFTAIHAREGCTLWLYVLRAGTRQALAPCVSLFTPVVAWSPDGASIVFTGSAEGAEGLFLVGRAGGAPRRLTRSERPAMADHQPAFSPDGQRVAFARADPVDGTRDLYETTLDGRVTRLSNERLYYLHGITYAPNGEDLVYSSTRQDARQLFLWERRTARAVALGLQGSAPQRAADGSLVHALSRAQISIGRVALNGSAAPQRLIASISSDRQPHADVGSQRVVFTSRRSGHQEVWLVPIDGSNPRALTQLAGVTAAPTLSPDGKFVAFLGTCGEGKRYGLCMVDIEAGRLTALAADGFSYGDPAWHPDGGSIWVASDRDGEWKLWRFTRESRATAAAAEPVATAAATARRIEATRDAIVYGVRLSNEIRQRDLASGVERGLAAPAQPAAVVDWRLHPRGVLMLLRDTEERFELIDPSNGRREVLRRFPLGSFPERASFALVDNGAAVLVELGDTGSSDLMLAR
jgi:Tol biopolymer transport system component/DNA-binding winged helix-turn-helix (wHTH) protein